MTEDTEKMTEHYARMWGHYANGSYGVCIEFNPHENLVELIKNPEFRPITLGWYNNRERNYFWWGKVRYDSHTPLKLNEGSRAHYEREFLSLREKHPEIENVNIGYWSLILMEIIQNKHAIWSDEEELRLVLFRSKPKS